MAWALSSSFRATRQPRHSRTHFSFITRSNGAVSPHAFQRCACSSLGTKSNSGISRTSGSSHAVRRKRNARPSDSRMTRTGAKRSPGRIRSARSRPGLAVTPSIMGFCMLAFAVDAVHGFAVALSRPSVSLL
eukprot:5738393-Pyramimonas_sp.AAC.1